MLDLATILANPNTAAKIKELTAEVNLPEEREEIVEQILLAYLQGQILAEEISLDLEDKAGLEFSQAVKLAWDLLEQVVEPMPLELKAYVVQEVPPAMQEAAVKDVNLDQLILDIKKEANVTVAPLYEKRLAEIIFGWFRGIQDDPETIDKLIRSTKIGGVQLLYDDAKNLVAILNKKKAELGDGVLKALNKRQAVSAAESQPVVDEEIDVSAKPGPKIDLNQLGSQEATIEDLLAQKGIGYDELIKKAYAGGAVPAKVPPAETNVPNNFVVKEIEAEEEFLNLKPELQAPEILPMPETAQASAPKPVKASVPPSSGDILTDLGLPKLVPAWKQSAAKASQPATVNNDQNSTLYRKQENNDRPRVEDVKGRGARLYGPIEELASLTLVDFRRLSKDPLKAAGIISQKLEVLENDSLEKRATGIKALKASPLYKIYADIMNKAFSANQSYAQIIEQRGDITMAEYQAIMGLNKSLKY